MSAMLENFLNERLPLPGIVACAARQAGHPIISRRDGDALTTAQVEQALIRLAAAAERLKGHGFEGRSLCWTFDQARIHLSHRPDGTALAVFCENVPGQPPNAGALQLIRAFQELAEV